MHYFVLFSISILDDLQRGPHDHAHWKHQCHRYLEYLPRSEFTGSSELSLYELEGNHQGNGFTL